MHTNGQILSAVISYWTQPLMGQIVTGKIGAIPFLGMAENWIKNLGIVSPNYSIMKDLAPVIEGVSSEIIMPFLNRYLSMVDDDSLPAMAHGVVDRAIENGELSLAEGFLVIEETDLRRLKRLLELNLPLSKEDCYIVKTV